MNEQDSEFNDDDDEDEKSWSCASCRRRIELGGDVFAVEEGVIGLRGVVPLEPITTLCSLKCISEYFNGSEPTKVAQRIP